MSEVQNTQPVVTDTDTKPLAGSEVTNARNDGDDLDTLLNAYDEQVTKPPATPKPEPKPGAELDLKATLEQVKGFVSEANAERFRRDMDKTIKDVRGELNPDVVDDGLVEAWIDAEARKDPRLSKAWVNRNDNPRQFEKVKTELGKKLANKFSKLPDKQATEDREAVTAAVRGASTRTPEGKAPDYGKLSEADFQKEKDKLFG